MSLGIYFLLGVLLHALVAWAARDETNRKRRDAFVFVHMADPQLGMLNQFSNKEDWRLELDMAKQLAAMVPKIIDPAPKFLFLGGDMQNEWPNTGTQTGNDTVAALQRKAVKDLLQPVLDKQIRITCTPGNHDVGDKPQVSNLVNYSSWWSEFCTPVHLPQWKMDDEDASSTASRWVVHKTLFLQIDSQLYWTDAEGLDDKRRKQTEWLRRQVNQATSRQKNQMPTDIERIVMLTHIPPFMHQPNETHGWANWHEDYRTGTGDQNVLAILEAAQKPVQWVCGHFHTNVKNDASAVHKIRVTSSAGTTMWWHTALSGNGNMEPQDAAVVAGMDVGKAFCEKIAYGTYDATQPPHLQCSGVDWTAAGQKAQRMKPIEERSGIRIFYFPGGGGTPKDNWFTLETLKTKAGENDGALPITSLGLA